LRSLAAEEPDDLLYSILGEPDLHRTLAKHGIKETHPYMDAKGRPIYLVSRALDSSNPYKAHKYRKHEALYIPPYYHEIRKVHGKGTNTLSYQVSDGSGRDGWLNRPHLPSEKIGTTSQSDALIVAEGERLAEYRRYDILPGTGRDNCQTFVRELANQLTGWSAEEHLRSAPAATFAQRHRGLKKISRALSAIREIVSAVKGEPQMVMSRPLRPLPDGPVPEWALRR
jgi:hypothetical protein